MDHQGRRTPIRRGARQPPLGLDVTQHALPSGKLKRIGGNRVSMMSVRRQYQSRSLSSSLFLFSARSISLGFHDVYTYLLLPTYPIIDVKLSLRPSPTR